MSGAARWNDLAPRLISAAVMLIFGAMGVWLGGAVFSLGVCALGGLMIWELARMVDPGAREAVALGVLGAAALLLAWVLPGVLVLPVLLAAALVGAGRMPRDRGIFLAYGAGLLLACYAFIVLREVAGLTGLLWLIAVVVVTDVAGYFVGRTFGGPKFWPRVSPKKTWSGTAAGWVAAAIMGVVFVAMGRADWVAVPVSVLVSLASQMGDITESAIKRREGVKDSSNLIPGHGGVLDRFDGMLGAGLVVGVIWILDLMPVLP